MNSPNPSFRLRFPERDIPKWAARFPDTCSDDSLLTRAALATSDEALKIDLLRLLDGVAWSTASGAGGRPRRPLVAATHGSADMTAHRPGRASLLDHCDPRGLLPIRRP